MSALAAYLAFLERLAPETLDLLDPALAPDVVFTDPFNRVEGAAAVKHVYADMLQRLHSVRYEIHDVVTGERSAYLRWTAHWRMKPNSPEKRVEGVTELRLEDGGRITAATDHWDAASQIYEDLPLLGWVLKTIRRRLAA